MAQLSVIVPLWKAQSTVGALLDSLLCLSGAEFIFCASDASADYRELIARWAEVESALLVEPTEELSAAAARNLGLEFATSDLVCFVDADDLVLPAFAEFVEQHRLFGADISVSSYVVASANDVQRLTFRREVDSNREAGTCQPVTGVAATRAIMRSGAVWGKIYNRRLLVENEVCFPDVPVAEDVVFLARVARRTPLVLVSSLDTYVHLTNQPGQLTSSRSYSRKALAGLRLLAHEASKAAIPTSFVLWVDVLRSVGFLLKREVARVHTVRWIPRRMLTAGLPNAVPVDRA